MMKRVLVTGATGFVGSVLCELLHRSGYAVRAALRTRRPVPECVAETTVVGNIDAGTDWTDALRGVDAVIHAAARVHIMHDEGGASDLYMETNARGTSRLAQESARVGVRRMVHLSSVKVNGEESGGRPYSSDDEPHPADAYAESKLLAEKLLSEIAAGTGMEALSVRSPLVYGPGVRANFLRLMSWVDKEWPLPLGAVDNRRSLVSIWNLCDLLVHVLNNPVASGRTWMVSDGEDLSTPELIRRIGSAMDRRVTLLPVPARLLHLVGALTGKRAEMVRLCGSLAVNVTQTRDELGWSPPVSVNEALARTVDWYLGQSRSHEV